jgi:hypothetical protein
MLNARIARTLFVLALPLGLAACAASTLGPWQKAGADDAIVARDTSECRSFAKEEAARRYLLGSSTYGPTVSVLSQQGLETDRTTAEAGLFNSCMQNRGYTRASAQ